MTSNNKRAQKQPATEVVPSSTAMQAAAPMMEGAVAIRGGKEIASSQAAAEAMTEIQARVIMARQFPRDEAQAATNLINACKRLSFAEDVEYSFKRGKKKNDETDKWEDNFVSGPSVVIAREAARVFGHIDCGFRVIAEDMMTRTLEGFALDLQTGTKFKAQDTFEKKIQRKVNGQTEWVAPDERDLRELQNKRGALLERNCILRIIPRDIIEDALLEARTTVQRFNESQKDEATKRLVKKFGSLGVNVDMLSKFLGIDDLTQITTTHLEQLRPIYTSIKDGNSRWSDYTIPRDGAIDVEVDDPRPTTEEPPAKRAESSLNDVLAGAAASSEANRGHGDTNLKSIVDVDRRDAGPSPNSDDDIREALGDEDDENHVTDANATVVGPEAVARAQANDQQAAEAKVDNGNGRDGAPVEEPPMNKDVLALQHRAVMHFKRDVDAAEAWLARASRLVLPNGFDAKKRKREFRSLSPLEARTISESLDANEIRL